MEEKRYPGFEEEDGADMCQEPLAAVEMAAKGDGINVVHDELDDLDWNNFPSYGPCSVEEAIARVERAEADLNASSKWIRVDNLHAELKKIHSWL